MISPKRPANTSMRHCMLAYVCTVSYDKLKPTTAKSNSAMGNLGIPMPRLDCIAVRWIVSTLNARPWHLLDMYHKMNQRIYAFFAN